MVNHTGTVPIETPRLLLRRFVLEDDNAMFTNWANDDEVTKHLYWPTHTDVGVSRKVLEDWVASYEKHDYYQWAIVLKEIGEPIGSIAAVAVRDRDENCEIGYCMGKAWWGKGIMTEALKAVMAHFFAMGMERVAARHKVENPASGKVMIKCGMRPEGVMRHAHKNKQGGYSDLAIYAAVRGD